MIRKAALLAVLSAALIAPSVAAAPGAAAAISSRQGVNLTLSAITPDYATGQATQIKITGSVTNPGGTALTGLRVRVRYSAQRFADRASMATFQADQTPATQPSNVSTQSSMVIPELGASASVPFELTMTPAQFGLTAFGAYPLSVEVMQWDSVQLASQRTFLTYAPPTPRKPLRNRLAVALPLIDQPHRAHDTLFVDDRLSDSTTGKGRLSDLARIAESAPASVTWFVDPALFDDAQAMTKPFRVKTKEGVQERPADPAVGQWLTSMRASLADNPVVAIPYADPDVTALAHQGLDDQAGLALALGGTRAAQHVKPEVRTSTYWPASGRLDADALDLLAVGEPNVAKVDKVLLDPVNVPPQQASALTPDAATTLDTVMGPITALVADAELSRTFEPPQGTSTLLSRQRFIAETAMISAEPGQTRPRSLVVAPSRRWDPSPTLVSTLLKTAAKLPWLSLTSLDSLKAGAVQVPRAGLTYIDADRKQELNAKYLATVKEVAAKARLTGLITGKSQSAFDAAVLRLSSSAWRGNARAGRAVIKMVNDEVDSKISDVSITGADPNQVSPRTLAGSNGEVPISVKNSLPDPISLFIDVRSNNPELLKVSYEQTEPLRIIDGQSGTVQVPMTVASTRGGDATVTVQLKTSDGTPYGNPVKLTVRTTGYTGIALVIVGAALTVMMAAVVTRVLRRRSQRRTARAARTRESGTG